MKGIITISLALAIAGCDRKAETPTENPDKTGTAADQTKQPAADNTEKNERDRNPEALTPGDQGETKADLTITQQVRQQVVKDDALSTTAKNVKIITVDRVVTLRGPVNSTEEKAGIAAIATRVDGVKRVNDQLEIAAK